MRASIIVAAHNEGQSLWKTIRSCVESIGKLDYELLIADDASDDESVEEAIRRFPQLSVHRHDQRQGASPTKHTGASSARGEVLVFLDGHCNPERGAIERLVEDVQRLEGKSIITPTVLALDTARWKNKEWQVGHGYRLELDTFDCGWLPLASLSKVRLAGRQFCESPAAIGCAFAVHRELYDDLRGFDPHMRIWGVEDLDFSLKCWLMGHSILHDPEARIGHRFRRKFDNYQVPVERIVVNKLRMAYKNFTPGVWSEWLERCRQGHWGGLKEHPEGLWACAWNLFDEDVASAKEERRYFLARRECDEFWYAQQFGLSWPRLQRDEFSTFKTPAPEFQVMGSPSPSPAPAIVDIDIEGVDDAIEATGEVELVIGGARRKIMLSTTFSYGNVRLSRDNEYIDVYQAETGGVPLQFDGSENVYSVISLPREYWAEGSYSSEDPPTTGLTLEHIEDGATDFVVFLLAPARVNIDHQAILDADEDAYSPILVKDGAGRWAILDANVPTTFSKNNANISVWSPPTTQLTLPLNLPALTAGVLVRGEAVGDSQLKLRNAAGALEDIIKFTVVATLPEIDMDIEGVADEDEVSQGKELVKDGPRVKVTLTTTYPGGHVRLTRENDKIDVYENETDGPALQLDGTDNVFPVTALDKHFWVQGAKSSENERDTGLLLEHVEELVQDCVKFTVNPRVDLDIEGVIDEVEESLGAVLVRPADGSDGARRKVVLNATFASGSVRLSLQNSPLRVFTAAVAGDKLSFNGVDNVFGVSALPKELWVQGHLPSVGQRDTSLTLTHLATGASDRVTFTVLSERRRILLLGYWPPTDVGIRSRRGMLWDWQLRVNYNDSGYDVMALSPTFTAAIGFQQVGPDKVDFWDQGTGILPVDYPRTSRDFWRIVEEIRPIAIMRFSRDVHDQGWEFEDFGTNFALHQWVTTLPYTKLGGDPTDPADTRYSTFSLPPAIGGSNEDIAPPNEGRTPITGNPPDAGLGKAAALDSTKPNEPAAALAKSNLPMDEMIAALKAQFAATKLVAQKDTTEGAGSFVSNYMA